MAFGCCRVAALSAVLLLIAGCGGGNTGTTGGGGPTSTTVTFTFQGSTPTAVAASIGSGAFAAETLNGSTLTLTIPSGTTKFAVAYACPAYGTNAPITAETVFEATTTDGTSFSQTCIPSPTSGTTLGTYWGLLDVSAIPNASTSSLEIVAGNATTNYWNGSSEMTLPQTYFVIELAPGSYRMMAGLMNSSYASGPGILIAAKDLGTQTVPGSLNGGNAVVLGTADEATPEAITYNNVPSGFSSPTTTGSLVLGGGGVMPIASGATNQYGALPAAASESGDSYFLIATAVNSGNPLQGVEAFRASTSGGPATFNFPAAWVYGGPAAAALPTFNMNYTGFAGQTGVYDLATLFWGYSSPSFSSINILATKNYQGGSTTLAVPDLSALNGFLVAPSSGTEVYWTAMIAQSSASMSLSVPLKANGSAVSNGGSYAEP